MQDVDLKEQTVTIVNGKGGKSRLLPTDQYAAYYIEQYVKRARKYLLKGKRDDLIDDNYNCRVRRSPAKLISPEHAEG